MTPRMEEAAAQFVSQAKEFSRRYGSSLVFRTLKFFTRCGEDDLEMLAGRIYCSSLPCATSAVESGWRTWLGIPLLPFAWLAGKRIFWKKHPLATLNFETPDEQY